MIKISYRAHDYGKSNAKDLAEKISHHKLTAVQFVINKAIDGESGLAGTLTKEKCEGFYNAFHDKGIEISMLGAYFNPVHSNKEKVEQMILKFKEHLKYAKYFHTKYVGTETGSYNDDKWTYNPLNRTEEALQEDIRIFSDLAECAKENDAYIVIEGAYGHCMYSPDQLKRLFDAINNGHVKITIDIFNYLDISNYKAKREKHLIYEVKNLCQDVLKTKMDVKLDPMNSYERRIVHSTVSSFKNLITESEGESPNRYVVIRYKED